MAKYSAHSVSKLEDGSFIYRGREKFDKTTTEAARQLYLRLPPTITPQDILIGNVWSPKSTGHIFAVWNYEWEMTKTETRIKVSAGNTAGREASPWIYMLDWMIVTAPTPMPAPVPKPAPVPGKKRSGLGG